MNYTSTETQNVELQKDVQRLKSLAQHWQVTNSALRKDIDGLETTLAAMRETICILKRQMDIKDTQIKFLAQIRGVKNATIHKRKSRTS